MTVLHVTKDSLSNQRYYTEVPPDHINTDYHTERNRVRFPSWHRYCCICNYGNWCTHHHIFLSSWWDSIREKEDAVTPNARREQVLNHYKMIQFNWHMRGAMSGMSLSNWQCWYDPIWYILNPWHLSIFNLATWSKKFKGPAHDLFIIQLQKYFTPLLKSLTSMG